MFKNKYYCLVAGLPDLLFGDDKSVPDVAEFKNQLEKRLHPTDFELVQLLFLPSDNKNLVNLLFNIDNSYNENGNFKHEFLEAQIQQPDDIPEYMIRYINWAKSRESKEWNIQAENKLTGMFYEHALKSKNDFLSQWYQFELYMRNIIIAHNCINYDYTLCQQMIVVNGYNEVRKMLSDKKMKPEYYEDFFSEAAAVFRIAESGQNMEEKEKELDKIKWNWLDEHTFFYWFTIEKILSYTLKLIMIERWSKIDKKTGEELLINLIDELAESYSFGEEFSL